LNKKRSNNYRLVYWKGPNICKGIPKFLLRQYDPNLIRGCDTCFYNQFILGLTNERTWNYTQNNREKLILVINKIKENEKTM